MKNLVFFFVLISLPSLGWGETYSGTLVSMEVKYDQLGVQKFRYYFKLNNSNKNFFLEVKDGRSEAIVNAQYSLLLSAYTLGHTVVFETDYDIAVLARVRDIRIVK